MATTCKPRHTIHPLELEVTLELTVFGFVRYEIFMKVLGAMLSPKPGDRSCRSITHLLNQICVRALRSDTAVKPPVNLGGDCWGEAAGL